MIITLCNNNFLQKFFFVSTQFHNHFFCFTKITQHYFYKTCKIIKKFDGVSQTFSISSLKFLLKLASHYEKLRNISEVFHLWWETVDLWFLWVVAEQAICSQLVNEQSQNFVYRHKFTILSTSVYYKQFVLNLSMNNHRTLSIDTSSQFCLQVCTKSNKQ